MDAVGEQVTPNGAAPRAPWRWWLVAVAVVTVPFLGLIAGRESGIYGDLQHYHLPLFQWVWKALGDGHSPFWAGWAFGGQNVAGIGQGAVWYPPNALFGVFGVVTAYRWWLVLHLWLATSGAFVWTWRRWGSAPGATVGAIVYGLNGALVLHLVHANFTISSAWLPWVCIGLDGLIQRGGLRRYLAFALPLTMIAVSGHPQMLWAALVVVAVFAVSQLSVRGTGLRPWLRVATGSALGIGLAAVHLLPQFLFSRTSYRPKLTQSDSFEFTATVRDLLTSVFPHLGEGGVPGTSGTWLGAGFSHEVANHIGAAAVALAMVAVVARRRDRRVIGLVVVTVSSFVLSLGDATPFGPLAWRVVPFANKFRIWPRYLILANLSMACLAALGTSVVLAAPAVWRRRLLVGTATTAAAGVVLAIVATQVAAADRTRAADLAVPVGIALLALLAVVGATWVAVTRPFAAAAIVIAACAVPAVVFTLAQPWHTTAMTTSDANDFFDHARDDLRPFDEPGGIDRWLSQRSGLRGVERVANTARVDGYEPLLQADFSTVTGAVYVGGVHDERVWQGGWIADVLRISTIVVGRSTAPNPEQWQRADKVADSKLVRWRHTPRLAEASVIGAVTLRSFDDIAYLLQTNFFDLTGTVLLETGADGVDRFAGRDTPGAAGTVTGSFDGTGNGRFTVQADRPAVLLLSNGWLDGWSATVNGRDVPVVRGDGLVLAIPVEAGKNDVHLTFTPPGLLAGGAITAAVMVVIVGWGGVAVVRRRRAVPAGPDMDVEPGPDDA
jgi:hypothetical protein